MDLRFGFYAVQMGTRITFLFIRVKNILLIKNHWDQEWSTSFWNVLSILIATQYTLTIFFSSYELFAKLAAKNIRAIDTVRENRTQNCPLKSKAVMRKSDRGSYDFRSNGIVEFVSWNDNNIVICRTNFNSVEPTVNVKKRVKQERDAQVTQPKMIQKYNHGMGGVELIDMLSTYRPRLVVSTFNKCFEFSSNCGISFILPSA